MTARPDTVPEISPNITGDADIAARRGLARQKRHATGLLVVMAGFTLGSYAFGHGYWIGLLQASAKAGLVGGLADWFAVTALFRHPLGLPIPHTAIVPAQKERLGRALGSFIASHVFTEAEIERALGRLDMPLLLRGMLMDPRTASLISGASTKILPHLLDGLEAGRAQELIARLVPRLLSGGALAPVVARALRALVDGDRHQEVLSFLLDQIRLLLKSREAHLHQLIEDRVREQGGRLMGWAIGGSIASRVLSAINTELERTDPRDSELREAVTAWIRDEIDLIETDPQRGRDLGEMLRGLVTHESIRLWVLDVWARTRGVIEGDLDQDESWVRRLVSDAVARLGQALETDQAVRAGIDRAVLAITTQMLPTVRDRMSGFIAQVVGNWDTRSITEKLELRVGPDLQFVRINGTLVGSLVGGLLYVLLHALFGGQTG
ncbi:DUF445 domain-containing protein [Lichenicola cladoniae]|uniref:DUF445 domain-containing protein n=1 Tax=Lichenicola cladoniae TaxID=1484109 RepID=A0A6M8HQH3_9PROT|nr:DUF445 domain-containing protein [Lichenicola cladoniae]NPD67947.1 DUF445 domain-containing protein [Acetobacteraceae bacterium]QKE90537.1 DUF445 domain-containing protein [Lichenicola cladoniae]